MAKGSALFGRYCFMCHGPGAVGGVSETPDLRYSDTLGSAEAIKLILLDGALKHNGMVSFAAALFVRGRRGDPAVRGQEGQRRQAEGSG